MSWAEQQSRALNRGEERDFSQQNQKQASPIANNGENAITMLNEMKTGEGVTEIKQTHIQNLTKVN